MAQLRHRARAVDGRARGRPGAARAHASATTRCSSTCPRRPTGGCACATWRSRCACPRAASPAASTGSSATASSSARPSTDRSPGHARPPHRCGSRADDGGRAGPRRQRPPAPARPADRGAGRRSWPRSSSPCAPGWPTGRSPDRWASRSPAASAAHVANVGIKDDTDDFTVVAADAACAAAGVFTAQLVRRAERASSAARHVADGQAQAVVVVSKNANVATGAAGPAPTPRSWPPASPRGSAARPTTCSSPPPG